jgi:hypothetical protein
MGFSEYYKEQKDDIIFEKTFDKFYKRGHYGKMDRVEICTQQKEWFLKLKTIIQEKDYGSLMTVVGHRNSQVTRELFSKLTKINIKKKRAEYIKERLKEYCYNEVIKKKRKKFKDMIEGN